MNLTSTSNETTLLSNNTNAGISSNEMLLDNFRDEYNKTFCSNWPQSLILKPV